MWLLVSTAGFVSTRRYCTRIALPMILKTEYTATSNTHSSDVINNDDDDDAHAIMAHPQVVAREDGVEADGALRRMLDGDSDCGSVLPLQDYSMEGEKRPRRLEGKQVRGGGILQKQQERVGSQKPERTQRVEAQVPGREEGIARSPRGTSEARDSTDWPPDGGGQSKEPAPSATTAVVASEVTSSTLGGSTPRDPKSPTALSKTVSVRAKIEMFERTARSAAGEEGRNRSSSLGSPVACHRQPLGRSLSAKASAREWAFSASVDRSQQPSAFENGGLARALSFPSSSRLARGGATPGFVANTADPPIADKGVVS